MRHPGLQESERAIGVRRDLVAHRHPGGLAHVEVAVRREAPGRLQLVRQGQITERDPLRGPRTRDVARVRRQCVRDAIALRSRRSQVIQRARHVRMALDRRERRKHGEGVLQPLMLRIQPDVRGDVARQQWQVQREELVEVGRFQAAGVQRLQHLGRDQRDARRALACDGRLHARQAWACCSSCFRSSAKACGPLP
jgi:hypothetical protein